jgi:UDP-N-acetylglucosamine 2-epimerase (non-hydrolysing)
MMHIMNVVGARPNLMKIAPLVEEMRCDPDIESTLLHTGQHYDAQMSQIFFDELGIPQPQIYLGVGSGSHAEQTARVMIDFEKVLLEHQPDLVLVVGDINSTLACALTAAKLQIPVAHVEAGLRSRDRTMPEEINRIVTDAISDLLFTPSRDADENLLCEGIAREKIHFVGNVMIDTLYRHRNHAKRLCTPAKFGVEAGNYLLVTLHRPSNVDDAAIFKGILEALLSIQEQVPILFPVHPRTIQRIQSFGFEDAFNAASNLQLIPPQGYLAFLDLMMHAQGVLTDSGGVQEETTALGVPCLTLRENTERPVTIVAGTNKLVGADPQRIISAVKNLPGAGIGNGSRIPELWDGRAAQRIVEIIRRSVSQ